MSDVNIAELRAWIGRQETLTDRLTPFQVNGLSAVLGYPESRAKPGAELPQPWHWMYFLPTVSATEIDLDGHPKRGGFLPPVPLPRRMWAGSKLDFLAPLIVGEIVERVSTIEDVVLKSGSTGQLVFVTVAHEIFCGEKLAIKERQNLVYREASSSNAAPPAKPAPADPDWKRNVTPDPVMLFRYSALTFNGHRIHYDRDYATEQEGYAGLVVHGPLTATLLLDLLFKQIPDAKLSSFSFRGVTPLVDTDVISLQGCRQGSQIKLWALSGSGALAMSAEATLV